MAEKCLIAATVAILICHPSSTIRCFKPNPNPKKKPHKKTHKPASALTPKKQPNPNPNLIVKISKVSEEDTLFGLVETIIKSTWHVDHTTRLKIVKVLRVSHGTRTLIGFERYRQTMAQLAQLNNNKPSSAKEYCAFHDNNNEIFMFHGTTICHPLGGKSSSNNSKDKSFDVCLGSSVSFFGKSWEAHEKLTNEDKSCSINNNINAMVVCRVVAGRVGRCNENGLAVGGDEGGFDSVVRSWRSGSTSADVDELFVLNPRAVLPCFVVTYSSTV